jgi:hypothetical protein
VLGHFILFSSTKSQGAMQRFGQMLAVWVFLLAALFPVMGAYATFTGFSPANAMRSMHSQQAPGLGPQTGSAVTKQVAAPVS